MQFHRVSWPTSCWQEIDDMMRQLWENRREESSSDAQAKAKGKGRVRQLDGVDDDDEEEDEVLWHPA